MTTNHLFRRLSPRSLLPAAGVGHPNVKALVYIADVGERAIDLTPLPGSLIVPPPVPGPTLIRRPCPPAQCGAGYNGSIDPAYFHNMFAGRATRNASGGQAIGTANVRVMAHRATDHVVEVNASHALMISEPEATARIIRSAARGTH